MTIYYLCPEHKNPVGGVRVIYRHVDILNKFGVDACVVHKTPGYRVTWFENDTRIVYWSDNALSRLKERLVRKIRADSTSELLIRGGRSRYISADDVLVIPEIYGPNLAGAIGRGIPKVILNQNCYLTFKGYAWAKERLITSYSHPDVIGTLINSVDGEDYLRFAFPELPVHRFQLSIDPDLFSYQADKKRQICFSRIKNQQDALQVVNLLKFRGSLKDFELVPFINVPQAEVARICKESMIFMSFGYPEGFGLPAAEAMACGCVVVGFHGGGGREFFKPEFSYPIEQGDIIGFARAVEDVIELARRNPGELEKRGEQASEFIRGNYSPEKEEEVLMAQWRKLLDSFQRGRKG